MRPDIAQNERATLQQQLRFARICLVAALASVFLLGLLDAWQELHQTTAVVPPEVRRPYVIGAGTANDDYLTDMSGYVLDKMLNTSPETVDYNNAVILKMTAPEQYPALKTTLDVAAMRIKRERITTLWAPRSLSIERGSNRGTWTGILKTYVSDVLVSSEQHSYVVELSFDISGRTYVSKAAEVLRADGARGGSATAGH